MALLTPEHRSFLLEKARTGKLASVRSDGRPHVAPIWFTLAGDTIIFTTWHTTVKAQNIRHDAHVSLCVDDETPPFAFILLEGTASMTADQAELRHWATVIGGRYMGQDQDEAHGQRNGVEGELVVRVTLTKVLLQKNITG